LTCSRCFPCGAAARDLCSGSGLTANRTNLLNASELCLAFNWVSRSPRPALCYRPLPAFPPHFAVLRVTRLEPRTPHQPEKLKKLSKNDLVVLLLLLESIKSWRFYLIYFQSSASRPQARDRILCNPTKCYRAERRRGTAFRDAKPAPGTGPDFPSAFSACENLGKPATGKESQPPRAIGCRALTTDH
jgi:hypothetical protein